MKRWYIVLLKIALLAGVLAGLIFLFPAALKFVEMAGRELRYFWWVIFLLALAVWLIWGLGRKKQ
jgi:uncharacterized protein with PQ loop repeat